jgi:hypothetical protein
MIADVGLGMITDCIEDYLAETQSVQSLVRMVNKLTARIDLLEAVRSEAAHKEMARKEMTAFTNDMSVWSLSRAIATALSAAPGTADVSATVSMSSEIISPESSERVQAAVQTYDCCVKWIRANPPLPEENADSYELRYMLANGSKTPYVGSILHGLGYRPSSKNWHWSK